MSLLLLFSLISLGASKSRKHRCILKCPQLFDKNPKLISACEKACFKLGKADASEKKVVKSFLEKCRHDCKKQYGLKEKSLDRCYKKCTGVLKL